MGTFKIELPENIAEKLCAVPEEKIQAALFALVEEWTSATDKETEAEPAAEKEHWWAEYLRSGKLPERNRSVLEFVHPTGRTAEEVDAYLEEMREERLRW